MINLNFLKIKKDFFTSKNILKLCSDFWDKYFKFLFFLFSLVVLFLGVYFWFQMTYQSDWSAEQKKQYRDSQSKEVSLKEQQFKNVIEELERKKEIYGEYIKASKDIFASYAAENQAQADNSQSTKPSSNKNTSTNNVSGNSIQALP